MANQFLNFNDDAFTEDGEYGPFKLDGHHAVVISGDLGGATVSIYHKVPDPSSPGSYIQAEIDPDMVFTALPAPFEYHFSAALPVFVDIANAGNDTSILISAYKID